MVRAEHSAYAIPFPERGERFDRYEEQLAIITGLWETPVGENFSFDGTYYKVTDSPGAAQAGAAAEAAGDHRRGGPAPDAAAGREVRR